MNTLLSILLGLIMSLACINVGFAQTPLKNTKVTHSIVGTPIGGRDNYTLNTKKAMAVKLDCKFINTGNTDADMHIWTTPTSPKPEITIHLTKGSVGKPSIKSKTFLLKSATHWWCLINLPDPQKTPLRNCGYFAIADATLVTHNPFAVWDNVVRPKHASYQCQITNPDPNMSFFAFVR